MRVRDVGIGDQVFVVKNKEVRKGTVVKYISKSQLNIRLENHTEPIRVIYGVSFFFTKDKADRFYSSCESSREERK